MCWNVRNGRLCKNSFNLKLKDVSVIDLFFFFLVAIDWISIESIGVLNLFWENHLMPLTVSELLIFFWQPLLVCSFPVPLEVRMDKITILIFLSFELDKRRKYFLNLLAKLKSYNNNSETSLHSTKKVSVLGKTLNTSISKDWKEYRKCMLHYKHCELGLKAETTIVIHIHSVDVVLPVQNITQFEEGLPAQHGCLNEIYQYLNKLVLTKIGFVILL